jgi:WD40 repeat protein
MQVRPGDAAVPYFPWEGTVGFLDWRKQAAAPVLLPGLEKKEIGESAFRVALDGAGQLLAVSWLDGQVTLHDSATGILRWQAPPLVRMRIATPIAFSRDGEYLALVDSSELVVYAWKKDPIKPMIVGTKKIPNPHILAFSSDARLLAAAYYDESIVLWNVKTRRQHRILQGHTGKIQALAFHPDGKWLATGGDDQTVRLWDAWSGQLVQTLTPSNGKIMALAFNGQYLAVGGTDLILYEFVGSPVRQSLTIEVPGNLPSVAQQGALHPREPWLALSYPPDLLMLDLESLREMRRWPGFKPDPQARTVRQKMIFSPSPRLEGGGGALATFPHSGTGADGPVCLWDPANGKLLKTLDPKGQVRDLAFDSQGMRLAALGRLETWVWHLTTGTVLQRWPDTWTQAAFVRQNQLFLLSPGKYRLTDADTGGILAEGNLPHAYFRFLFAPDERWLLLGGKEHIAVYSFPELKPQQEIPVPQVEAMALCRRNHLLATSGKDRRVTLWDTRTWQKLCSFPEEDSLITYLAFTDDGARLIACGVFSSVVVYDLPHVRNQFAKVGLEW